MIRSRRVRVGAVAVLMLAAVALTAVDDSPAYADHHAPPAFPNNCPAGQAPPPGYPNPPPSAALPFIYTGPSDPNWSIVQGKAYSGIIRYEVPFKAIIFGGSIEVPAHGNSPELTIPNLYASLCGWVQLPELSGTIQPANINLAQPNIYVAHLEAQPVDVSFGTLKSNINLTPAHNGGLDITLHGATQSAVKTLGMVCSITLNASFTTHATDRLAGLSKPVTGPTKNGQAEVVSDSFGIPAIPLSDSSQCPPSIAQTFNNLLGLPLAPGLATFVAPFCFDFELEGPNTPAANKECPWPG